MLIDVFSVITYNLIVNFLQNLFCFQPFCDPSWRSSPVIYEWVSHSQMKTQCLENATQNLRYVKLMIVGKLITYTSKYFTNTIHSPLLESSNTRVCMSIMSCVFKKVGGEERVGGGMRSGKHTSIYSWAITMNSRNSYNRLKLLYTCRANRILQLAPLLQLWLYRIGKVPSRKAEVK